MDDGSTDDTKQVAEEWQKNSDFPIHYWYQENQGKHAAHNAALKLARGFFTVILDSDDRLAPDALERLLFHWENIPKDTRDRFAGIEGLCAYENGKIAGTRFPGKVLDSNYIETRRKLGVGGDKKNAIRTDVLCEFPFPVFDGEKFIRESIVWDKMAKKYSFRYINEVIQIIEYQADGLSSNPFRLRVNNPQGFRRCFQDEVNFLDDEQNIVELLNNYAKYVRYSLHCGIGYHQQYQDIKSSILWLLSIPGGTIDWLRDKVKIKRLRHI